MRKMGDADRAKFLEDHPNLASFIPFIDHLNKESARGAVLISCGFIEQQLEDVLRAFMRDDPFVGKLFEGANAPLSSLSSRISISYALGLLFEPEYHDLNVIRRIRNEFAHKVDVSFEDDRIKDLCCNLKLRATDYTASDGKEYKVATRAQFISAATGIILNLVNRPHFVSKERRTDAGWGM